MRVLSPEETKESNQEIDKFLMSLDYNTKHHIRYLIEPLLNQAKCNHVWIDPNTYENELDKSLEFCSNCHLTSPIDPLSGIIVTAETEGDVLKFLKNYSAALDKNKL